MSERVVKVPDVGEGVAEAELVEWHVEVGDSVTADQTLADVMTDKASVEIPAPVAGIITWRAGEPGDVLAVGSELVRIDTGDGGAQPRSGDTESRKAGPSDTGSPDGTDDHQIDGDGSEADGTDDHQIEGDGPQPDGAPQRRVPGGRPEPTPEPQPIGSEQPTATPPTAPPSTSVTDRRASGGPRPLHDVAARPKAAPAVRKRAATMGIDLRLVPGSGPGGRVTHDDIDRYAADTTIGLAPAAGRPAADDTVEDVKLIGLRKRIAQRMADATHVPHITYVDEVDLTLLQQLRQSLNDDGAGRPRLTLLPFVVRAIVEAVREHPTFNAHLDDTEGDAGTLRIHRGVHVGIATQTDNGLVVPVLRHAEVLDLFEIATEIERLANAARDGSATSAELRGSTITITSLGALGGIATTPIINRPEVAIVGVNKLQTRPVWDGAAFVPREMMNLSSSFDHRVIDGWDAAQFVQAIRRRLESPAPLLVGPR